MRFRAADKPCARSPDGECSGFVGRIWVDAVSGPDRTLGVSKAWCPGRSRNAASTRLMERWRHPCRQLSRDRRGRCTRKVAGSLVERHAHRPTRLVHARSPCGSDAAWMPRKSLQRPTCGRASRETMQLFCCWTPVGKQCPFCVISPHGRAITQRLRMHRSAIHHMPAQEERHDRQAAFDQRFRQPCLTQPE